MVSSKKYFKVILSYIICVFVSVCAFGVNSIENNDILENKPIDLVYKYIDLTDENLNREGIPQCKKDYDNNELLYSLRSVHENLPWINKIYIIMPNEKVKFLQDSKERQDKIIYVKDKDILDFDSASCISFLFNLHKLSKYGCSENIIYMDDDCFIGKKLKKSDFFYNKNNEIVPYVFHKNKIAPNQYKNIVAKHRKLKSQIDKVHTHSGPAWQYTRMSSFLFLCKILGKNIKLPVNLFHAHHNAISANLSEIEELYNLVNTKYKYAEDCLRAKFRNKNELQFQTLYSFYILNKYGRQIGNLSARYIDLAKASESSFDYDLYCINTGSSPTDGGEHYTDIHYSSAKDTMEKLFPNKTPFEI